MTLLLASVLNSTLVLALGLTAAAACRRRSAAVRHAILAAAILCATLMPAFEYLLPVIEWSMPGLRSVDIGATLVAALILFRHRGNVARLWSRTERALGT